MAEVTTVALLFEWAQLDGVASAPLMEALGLQESDHPRVLANVSAEDWDRALAAWRVGESPATPAQRSKAVVARGAAVPPQAPPAQAPSTQVPPVQTGAAAAPGAASALGTFALNTVTNQASDVVMKVLDGDELKAACSNYKIIFGIHPPPEEELTAEQLTAVKKVLDVDMAPYVDFSVWGPFGNRMVRKLKLHGHTFSSEGTFVPVEVAGPPSFDFWARSYQCLRTALISWKAVDLGRLDLYAGMVKRYVTRYGPTVWLQIYQAEVRCRSDHMERVRRRGEEERAAALGAGGAHPMDPLRPWNWVWGEVLKDADFWRIELEEPALLTLNRALGQAPVGDAAVSSAPKRFLNVGASAAPPQKLAKVHDVDGNVFRSSRKAKKLCEAFNQGACPHSPTSTVCPKNRAEVHQCSRCLETTHGMHACTRSDHPAQKSLKSEDGKGKGKGGWHQGKGKNHKGRWWGYY